jgi:hypothetical protein
VAHQPGTHRPAGFVLLDPERGLEAVGGGPLPGTPHAVCSRGEELFFVMSERDGVWRVAPSPDGEEWSVSHHWTLPGSSGAGDEHHLNGIDLVDGSLWVSGLGPRAEGSLRWSSSRAGFLFDLDREEAVLEGLSHPHSLLGQHGEAWACESSAGRVISSGGAAHALPGPPTQRVRGLAMSDRSLYLGVSKTRVGSTSGGTLEGFEGRCVIYELESGSEEPVPLADFSASHDEIFELMLV